MVQWCYMNWIATNIRFPEDHYIRLKTKAAKERKSVAAIIREATAKIVEEKEETSEERRKKADKLIKEFRQLAKENSKYVPKGFNFTKALREIRYQEV